MGIRARAVAVAGLFMSGLMLASGPALADCHIEQFADLPVTMTNHQPRVPAKINGRDAEFIADSGAFYSLITPGAAAEYGLKLAQGPITMRMSGVGGDAAISVATVKTFTLAQTPIPNVDFLVGGSEVGGVGVLGQNVLGLADVEYDLAQGHIRLMHPKDCGNKILAYWARDKPVSVLSIESPTPFNPHTIGEVWVNGVKLRAMFDTGAGESVLTLRAAARAGIKPGDPGVSEIGWSGGIGRRRVRTWTAPMGTFKVGDEEIRNTRIQIGDLDLDHVDMLVGADFFLSHRVWVSNRQNRMVFTYNGGPVFNLVSGTSKVMEAEGDEPAHASPTTATGEVAPTDAEGFSLRGAAFAARHDYALALADLDQACKLAPNEPRYVFQRAVVRLQNHRPLLAMADLDTVLKLKSDNVEALLMRANLKIAAGDNAGGRTDLDAAATAAPKSSDLRLRIGIAYVEAEAFDAALPQFDLWISAHPDDSHMGRALNGRCFVRGVLGRELDKALNDCNGALHRMADQSTPLDSRGLVHLRRGEFDKAIEDYSAALALDPKMDWALYGRGVAKQRNGLKADGDADIAAAVAMSPELAGKLKRLGILTP